MFYLCCENKGADQLICAFVFAFAKIRLNFSNDAGCMLSGRVWCNDEPTLDMTILLSIYMVACRHLFVASVSMGSTRLFY